MLRIEPCRGKSADIPGELIVLIENHSCCVHPHLGKMTGESRNEAIAVA